MILAINSAHKPFSKKRINTVKRELNTLGLSKLDLSSVSKEYTMLGKYYNKSAFSLIAYFKVAKYIKAIEIRLRFLK